MESREAEASAHSFAPDGSRSRPVLAQITATGCPLEIRAGRTTACGTVALASQCWRHGWCGARLGPLEDRDRRPPGVSVLSTIRPDVGSPHPHTEHRFRKVPSSRVPVGEGEFALGAGRAVEEGDRGIGVARRRLGVETAHSPSPMAPHRLR
jgi:hypothetical protein